ncbi:MAG: DUF4861 family protein [Bacteroidota bacterium]
MLRYLPFLLLFVACEPSFDANTFRARTQVLGTVAKIGRMALDSLAPTETAGLPYAVNAAGEALTSQLLYNDGGWTDLLVDAGQLEDVAGIEYIGPVDYPTFPDADRAQVYLGKRLAKGKYESITEEVRPTNHVAMQKGPDYLYQGEGPIWENDLVGFRTYFDSRNGYDIFGKTTDRFVAHEITVKGNYHELLDWGMDVLKVGNSYGAGALGLYVDDILRQLGDATQETFAVTEDGPLLASFRITFTGLEDFSGLTVVRDVTILQGLPGYLAENTLSGGNGETMATGIVTLNEHTDLTHENGNLRINATHGPQAELGKYLGMAVVTTTPVVTGKTPDKDAPVTTTNFVRSSGDRASFNYLFLAGWELQDEAYTDEATFLQRARDWATAYANW